MKIPTANSPPAPPKPPASIWRKAWRVFYWASIVAGAWMLVLMLRRAPSPQVTVSPQAAQSAEQKMLAGQLGLKGEHHMPPVIHAKAHEPEQYGADYACQGTPCQHAEEG